MTRHYKYEYRIDARMKHPLNYKHEDSFRMDDGQLERQHINATDQSLYSRRDFADAVPMQ